MASTEKMPGSREGKNLLVVEDDPSQSRALSALLQKEGFRVVSCRSTSEAAEQLEGGEFAVAIIDLRLPNDDGTKLFETIQAKTPKTRIIVYTGFGSYESAKMALNQGVFAYVEKGSDPADMVYQVQRAVEDSLTESLQESNGRLDLIEERYRTLIDELPLGVAVMDTEHNVVMVNESLAKMIGKPASEFVGRKCFQEFEKREAVCPHCPGVVAMATGKAASAETSGFRADGSVFHVSNRAVPDYGPDGEITGFIELVEDITERKRGEQALRESEEHFRTLFNNIADSICIHDATDARILHANDAALRRFGYTYEEFTRLAPQDVDVLQEEADVRETFARIHREGSVLFETVHRTKDGETFPAEVHAHLVDYKGHPVILAVSRDTTERKRAEQALRDSEALYSSLVQTLPLNIKRKDLQGRITFANKEYCTLKKCPLDELIGKTVFDLFPREQAEKYQRDDQTVIETGQILREVEEFPISDRKDGFVEVVKSPVCDSSGKVVGVQVAFWDVTDRKRAEEALRESEQRYRLLAENATDVIWTGDLNLKWTYTSPSVESLRGYTAEEAMRQTLDEMLTPASAALVRKTLAETLASAEEDPDVLTRPVTIEVEGYCKDGSTVWTEANVSFLLAEDGRPAGLIGVSRDIRQSQTGRAGPAGERGEIPGPDRRVDGCGVPNVPTRWEV